MEDKRTGKDIFLCEQRECEYCDNCKCINDKMPCIDVLDPLNKIIKQQFPGRAEIINMGFNSKNNKAYISFRTPKDSFIALHHNDDVWIISMGVRVGYIWHTKI